MHTRSIRTRGRLLTGGFSLVELLVSIAILVIITTVMLARYDTFNSGVLLKDLAYEIGLSIREAESFGIGTRADLSGQPTYGVHFVQGGTTYTVYQVVSGNTKAYTAENSRDVTTYQIGNGNHIRRVYIDNVERENINVFFTRPNPDAGFGRDGSEVTAGTARIVVGPINSTLPNEHTIHIYETGQIAIE